MWKKPENCQKKNDIKTDKNGRITILYEIKKISSKTFQLHFKNLLYCYYN